MDQKKQKQNTKTWSAENRELIDSYDYVGKACSNMDCTGLIPAAPESAAELDHYQELYPFMPRVAAPKKKHTEDI